MPTAAGALRALIVTLPSDLVQLRDLWASLKVRLLPLPGAVVCLVLVVLHQATPSLL